MEEVKALAGIIDRALCAYGQDAVLAGLKQEVLALCRRFEVEY